MIANKVFCWKVNCETDFVAKDAQFLQFTSDVAGVVLAEEPANVETLMNCSLASGETVENTRLALVSKIGENIQVRRFKVMTASSGTLGKYMHGNRIGVMVELESARR